MKKITMVLLLVGMHVCMTSCESKQNEVSQSSSSTNIENPERYYVKYTATCNKVLGGGDYYNVLSYTKDDGSNGQNRTTTRDNEVIVGPVKKGFCASASAYYTGMPTETNAAGINITTQIWVSYCNEPFALKRSISHVANKGRYISYTIE